MPILFKKHLNISYKKGTSALILFRFFDLFSVVFLLAISLFFINTTELNHTLLIIIAAFIIVLQIFIWIKLRLILKLVEHILKKIKIRKTEQYKEKLFLFFNQIIDYRESKNSLFLLKIFLTSLITWMLTYVTLYLIILSFNLNYSIMQVVFATSLASFTTLIPISAIGGFGTFEAGWAIGFVLLGMSINIAIPIGLFANILGIIISGTFAIFGYIYLLFYTEGKNV